MRQLIVLFGFGKSRLVALTLNSIGQRVEAFLGKFLQPRHLADIIGLRVATGCSPALRDLSIAGEFRPQFSLLGRRHVGGLSNWNVAKDRKLARLLRCACWFN